MNQSQKKVFLALNRYPNATDRELAEVLRMKRATVTVARNYLKKGGFFRNELFIDYKKLGVGVIGLKFGDYGKFTSIPFQKRKEFLSQGITTPETVFSFSSELKGFSMLFSENLCAIKEKIDLWNNLIHGIDRHTHIKDVYLPTGMIYSYKLMQTQELLAHTLELEVLKETKKVKRRSKFTAKDKMVLLAWFEHPDKTNEKLSEIIPVSRATIGTIKRRLLDSGLVKVLQVPSWEKLGFKMLVLTYLRPRVGEEKVIDILKEKKEIIFLVGSKYEVLFASLFRDFSDYHDKHELFMEKNKKDFVEQTEELIFPLNDTKTVINTLPFLKKKF